MFGSATEALELDLCEQAAHLHAAQCRWLLRLAEFDTAEGALVAGARSTAHWLQWKCGIAIDDARRLVRAARMLPNRPLIRDAFARGEIGIGKVQALCRVAIDELDSELLELARYGTTSQIERIVRAWRKARQIVDGDEVRRLSDARYLQWLWDDDGSLLLRGRLGPDAGAVVVQALEAIADTLRKTAAEARAADVASPADDVSDVPEAPLATKDPETVAQRRADALEALASMHISAETTERSSAGDALQVVVHVDADTLLDDSGARGELEDGPALPADTLRRLGCDASIVVLTEGAEGQALDLGRKTRSIPPSLRRALRSRDRGCRFPGCGVPIVDVHHAQHWIRGGPTSADNCLGLCRFHHHLVHEGGWNAERLGGGRFVFRDPAGRVVPARPPTFRGDPDHPRRRNRQLGLSIDGATCASRWDGHPLDLGLAVDGLLCANGDMWRGERSPPPTPAAA